MGLFGFIKDAGSNVFGGKDEAEPTRPLSQHVRENGIDPGNLKFRFDQNVVVISGSVKSQEEKEKVVMIVGNVKGVGQVDDQIAVGDRQPTPAAEDAATSSATEGGDATPEDWKSDTYTVKSGDTLSGIAKKVYGNAGKYMVIFEANKPMLSDPNKIYPGQVLRIPPLD